MDKPIFSPILKRVMGLKENKNLTHDAQRRRRLQEVSFFINEGIKYKSKGDFEKVIDALTMVIETYRDLGSSLSPVYSLRGDTFIDIGNYENALKDLTKAITLNPKCTISLGNRGTCFVNLKRYTEALDDFTKIIQIDPTDAMAYNNRGVVHHRLGQSNAAQNDWQKAIDLDSESPAGQMARNNLTKLS